MKLVGLAYPNGNKELLLKSDSSLLVNKKPFFQPEYVEEIAAHPCIVFRVCKLGKNISKRFAMRYVDSFAAGLHIEATDLLLKAQQEQHAWTKAIAFDGTLPVGTFIAIQNETEPAVDLRFRYAGKETIFHAKESITDAIAEISQYMTIRQGDLIFLCCDVEPFHPTEDQHIEAFINGEDNLFCKFK